MFGRKLPEIPTAHDALPGRDTPMAGLPEMHFMLGTKLQAPYPKGHERVLFGMGCFWGAERKMWNVKGVHSTAAGYAAGLTPHPNYREVCSGATGHNEVVQVIYAPQEVSFSALLRIFWEGHNPTQGMGQGNDVGTQYRSGIYTASPQQRRTALASREAYQADLSAAGHGEITTEILEMPEFYFAEAEHQQYLAKNPNGYCGLGGTGVSCPIGVQNKS